MSKERVFRRKDGSESTKCKEYYSQIKEFAEKNNYQHTLKSLELAIDLHEGQFRDGGDPYIVHPFSVTMYLIFLNVYNAVFDFFMHSLNNEDLAKENTFIYLDILYSASLLHDTWEDKKLKFPEYNDRIHEVPQIVWEFVNILSKDKDNPEFSTKKYFIKILDSWITILIKIADRVDNCSTIYVFPPDRMKKYINEVYEHFYPLIKKGKNYFPDFSRHLDIMKSFLDSVTETVASVHGMPELIQESNAAEMLSFIRGVAAGKNEDMSNTLMAAACAEEIYEGLKRKTGDDFIIHPIRVCLYLISLKFTDDKICAAALVHEAIKKCGMRDNAIELVTKWHLSPTVRDYVMIMASNAHYSLDLFYSLLRENPKVFLLKLANRVNTCTNLINMPIEEVHAYIDECENYIYPSCEFMIKEFPEYAYAINLMMFHLQSLCSISQNIAT